MMYNKNALQFVSLISLLAVMAVLASPLLTIMGYFNLDGEPKRHELVSKIAVVPFVLLAIANLSVPSYPQVAAAAAIAVLLYLFRDHYDQTKRMQGKYVQLFIILTAVYWASGLTVSGYAATVLFVGIGLVIPKFFHLISISSGFTEEERAQTSDSEYSLEQRGTIAEASASPIAPAGTPAPTAPAPEFVAPPVATPPATKKQKRYVPVDIVAVVASKLSPEEAVTIRSGFVEQDNVLAPAREVVATQEAALQAPPATVAQVAEGTVTIAAPAAPEMASAAVDEAPAGAALMGAAQEERIIRNVEPTEEVKPEQRPAGYRENNLSGFKLPKLPPRSAAPKPFKGTVDPEAIKTEQPKPKTSGVSFRFEEEDD